jgi:hypothetical protein
MGEEKLEVYRAFSGGQERHAYFVMAAAGAAIAFAVTQTETSSWNQLSLVWLGAITLWGLSFYFGAQHMAYVRSNHFANFNLLRAQEQSRHLDLSAGHGTTAAIVAGIKEAMHANEGRSVWGARLQMWTFIGGALVYLCWHVAAMVDRGLVP